MKQLFVLLFWLCSIPCCLAQGIPIDTTRQVVVETTDGNQYIGYLVRQTADALVLRTDNLGEINIAKRNIRSMRNVKPSQMVEGEYWPENPHSTRYLFGPNGYNLRKGEGYYSNIWIFYNQFSYGVTDYFTVGAGIVPLFFFAGTASPVWITPKFSIPIRKNKVNLGVGGLFATILGEEGGGSFGVAYGQLTLGPRDRNFNLGLGYGYAGDGWADAPTVTLGGIYRTSRKFAFMTENYLFDTGDDNLVLLSFGGRFIGRSVAIDGGLALPTETGGSFIAIPILGLNVPLGRPAGVE